MSAPTVCGQNADCIYILTVRGSERPPGRFGWSEIPHSMKVNTSTQQEQSSAIQGACWCVGKLARMRTELKVLNEARKKSIFNSYVSTANIRCSFSVCLYPVLQNVPVWGSIHSRIFIRAQLRYDCTSTTLLAQFFLTTGGGGLKKGHIWINNKSSGECKRYKDSLSTVALRKRTIQKTKLRHWTDTGLGLSVLLTFHAGLYCPVS